MPVVINGSTGISGVDGSAGTPAFQGSDTNTGIRFGTDIVSLVTGGSDRLYIDSSGRLGVGTSSPSYALDVISVSGSSIASRFRGNASGNNNTQIRFYGNNAATDQWAIGGSIATNDTGRDFHIYDIVAGQNRLAINSSGFVGIGSTAPACALMVAPQGSVLSGTGNNYAFYINPTSTGYVYLDALTGSTNNTSLVLRTYNNGTYNNLIQSISGNETTFSTAGTERARIDSSGRLLVGTNSVYADSSELFEVYKANGPNNGWVSTPNLANDDSVSWRALGGVSSATLRQSGIGVYKHSGIATPCGFVYMQATNADTLYYWTDNSSNFRISTLASNIGTTGGTVVGTQTSDERIKNILGPVEYGLDEIKQIEPVRYSLKAEPDVEKLGFIAQQVQPLIPQSIFDTNEHIEGEPEDAPTKLGMEYVSLIPVLVNAIKELSAEVDALKTQLQAQ